VGGSLHGAGEFKQKADVSNAYKMELKSSTDNKFKVYKSIKLILK
jgi:hypothetical protein